MKKRHSQYALIATVLFAVSGFWSNTVSAQGVITDETGDKWQSSLVLYLWATGLEGTMGVGGNQIPVDESFSDLAENLAGALSLRFESHKGKWGYFLDGMYVNLDPSATTPVGTITTDIKQYIFEAGGVYHFNPTVQGLFGARYQDLKLDMNFPGRTVSGDQDWADGFLGLRLVPVNTNKWRVWLRGDVGLVGDSDSTWNAAIGAGYSFNKKWSLLAAYRVLSTDVVQDRIRWDIEQSGFGLALSYTFQ
ncbi:outer membrane beta-barrel protein [Pseudomonadota bacterium]